MDTDNFSTKEIPGYEKATILKIPDDVIRIIADMVLPNERVSLINLTRDFKTNLSDIKTLLRREKKQDSLIRWYLSKKDYKRFIIHGDINEENLQLFQQYTGFSLHPIRTGYHLLVTDQDFLPPENIRNIKIENLYQLTTISLEHFGSIEFGSFDNLNNAKISYSISHGITSTDEDVTFRLTTTNDLAICRIIPFPIHSTHENIVIDDLTNILINVNDIGKIYYILNHYNSNPSLILFNEKIIFKVTLKLNKFSNIYYTNNISKIIVMNLDNLNYENMIFIYINNDNKIDTLFSVVKSSCRVFGNRYIDLHENFNDYAIFDTEKETYKTIIDSQNIKTYLGKTLCKISKKL